MYQVYFLTVITNLLAGTVLTAGFLKEKIKGFDKISSLLENEVFQLILGIASLLAGVLSLFKMNANDIVIIGDLLPSITSLVSGGLLLLNFLESRKGEEESTEPDLLSQLQALGQQYGTIVGFVALIAGLLHLISPTAVII